TKCGDDGSQGGDRITLATVPCLLPRRELPGSERPACRREDPEEGPEVDQVLERWCALRRAGNPAYQDDKAAEERLEQPAGTSDEGNGVEHGKHDRASGRSLAPERGGCQHGSREQDGQREVPGVDDRNRAAGQGDGTAPKPRPGSAAGVRRAE